jgi:acid phosphatase (class A)
MKSRTRWLTSGLALAAAALAWWWIDADRTHFLPAEDAAFIELFAAPPAPDSAQARRELDDLLALQQARSAADVAAARADRKTELHRFYGALGLDAENPPDLPQLERLAERVEDDVRIHVRQVKDRFRRLRPYEIEPRLEPCIDDVRGDLSYPSGHAAYAWSMAYLLGMMVPERKQALEARAAEFARQRMICGVHFPSDLAAGKQAAGWLLEEMRLHWEFSSEGATAAAELRAALGLAPRNFGSAG